MWGTMSRAAASHAVKPFGLALEPLSSVRFGKLNTLCHDSVRAAQVVRALRPITLIPRVNGLTVVVDTLYQVQRHARSHPTD